jgi:hypothetical protein
MAFPVCQSSRVAQWAVIPVPTDLSHSYQNLNCGTRKNMNYMAALVEEYFHLSERLLI